MGELKAPAEKSRSSRVDKVEIIIKSVERLIIVIGISIFLLFLCWKYVDFLGYEVLFVGIFLVIVIVLIEILLIERHRSHRK